MTDQSTSQPVEVLLVGQTPPPVGGQSLAIEALLSGTYRRLRFYHVRMNLSNHMDEVGKFGVGKLFTLARIILSILFLRARHGIPILYYPPSPPDRLSMYRDLAILLSVRWCFKTTVFHFHAGGISGMYDRIAPLLRPLFRWAYHGADAAIRISELNPPDGSNLHAKMEFIVPFGIEDHFAAAGRPSPGRAHPPRLLFVGVLRESKGVSVLIDACRQLRLRGLDFHLDLMGEARETSYERQLRESIVQAGLEDQISLLGRRTGESKWETYRRATIFCFPTFFKAETFGIVLIEAMQFGLPVVATRWRGVASVVDDGVTGYLVPTRDSRALADKLEFLIRNPAQAREMGARGRQAFLERYQLPRFYENIERVFVTVAG